MIVLYLLLGALGVLLLLVLIAVLRTLLTGGKTADWEPRRDPVREKAYAEKLAEMVRYETVSYKGQIQREKFLGFHALLETLFPLVHANLEKTEIDGSLLYYWKGRRHDKPIVLMGHQDVVPVTDAEWKYPPFSGKITGG